MASRCDGGRLRCYPGPAMIDPSDVPAEAPTEGMADSIAPGTLVAGRFRLATPVGRTADTWLVNGIDERSRRRVRLRFSVRPPEPERLDVLHPALPTVLDHGVLGPEHGLARNWVALDWFDGTPLSLDQTPHDASRTRRRTVIVAMLGLLDALERLHDAAGPHGSIARASLWLGDDGRLRLVDATAPPTEPSGGATWATPEGLRGAPRTVRTDVYAVGSLLVGWLSGRPPYGTEPAAARAGHLMRPLPAMTPVEGPLRDVVARAMHKRPEERYASAVAFRESLAAALRQVEPVALPLSGAATFPVGAPMADVLPPADVPRPRDPTPDPDPAPLHTSPSLVAQPIADLTPDERAPRRLAVATALIVAGLVGMLLAVAASLIGMGLAAFGLP